jgi:hypothetical protein
MTVNCLPQNCFFLGTVRGSTRLDCFLKECIRHELNVTLIIGKTDSYRKRWEKTEMDHEFRRSPSNIIPETERCGTSKTEMGIVKLGQDKGSKQDNDDDDDDDFTELDDIAVV